jgi:hypothetical protein
VLLPGLAFGRPPAIPQASVRDFGGVGLLQTPTARFGEDGDMYLGASAVDPYNRFFFTIQGLPWLEATLRYTEVTNRLYGPESFSGDQSYKDRGIDVKLRVVEEGKYRPQVALGFQDLGGTSLFSSEYLVANKRWYDWDFSLGVAWGYLGNRGGVRNPLGALFSTFNEQRPPADRAGGFDLSQLFRGHEVGIFGGVQYQTPVEGLAIKLEWDGNDYQDEPQDNDQQTDAPLNLGVTYRIRDWLDLSVGLERGNTVMARVALRSNLNRDKGLPKLDPPPVSPRPATAGAQDVPGRNGSEGRARGSTVGGASLAPDLSEALVHALQKERFMVDAVAQDGYDLSVFASQGPYREVPRAVGRTARVMASLAPPEVETLTVVNLQSGVESNRVTVLRRDLERAVAYQGSPEEVWVNAELASTAGDYPPGAIENPERYPAFDWSSSLALRQHIGGPDDFYFWQIWARLSGELEFARGLSLTGALGIDLANNLDGLRLESDSVLPHVRSDIKRYLQEGETGLVRLQADYLWKPGANWYARVSAGIFEEMFGGVGGELLYRPYAARWALGADLNWVKQRDYDMQFDFLDYDVVTGHGTLYYDLPFYDLQAALSVGRYLAGDVGATLNVSRRFENGMRVGAFVTRTDVSAEEFGEGSFDKGIYVTVPFDLFLLRSSRSVGVIGWRPLTRDGGQMVSVGKRLYGITANSNPGALARDWHRLLD